MSKGINKVILVGRVGRDPEVGYLSNGNALAKLSLATSEAWKDKQSGEKKEATEWHRVVAFGKLAEIIGQYVKKGGMVYVEGKLQTRQYEKDGQKHYSTEIVASELQMLDSRGGEAGPVHGGGQAPQPSQPAPFDDDVPFMRHTSNYSF